MAVSTMAATTTRTVRADDDVAIAYRVVGDGPRALVFLHGWAGAVGYYDALLAQLDLTGLRAILIDYRGHGESDKPERGYTLDRFARDVLAVADAENARNFVLVGFSMSGKFAQYITCSAPERVAGQILVAGCPVSEIALPDETRRDWIERASDPQRYIELLRWFLTQPVSPEVLDSCAQDAIKVPQVALEETLNMCMRTSFADRMSAVRTPTLVVGGLHDPLFTPETLRDAVMAPVHGARLVLLDANHEVPNEQPRELAGLIQAFLAGLGAGS